jgi:Glycosyltransferase WbsX
MPYDCTVACYYFPNYHLDARNQAIHGEGWTEWELVKDAKPRFEGHAKPNVPLWGYEDESDPALMAKKIDAAADHGIDAFIFDWYWYDDGPFLERGLDEGFLGAQNNSRLRFGLMWANHTWIDIHPATVEHAPKVLFPGEITPATFDTMTDHIIEAYFKHPSYWLIDGCPYFSVYELHTLITSFGSLDATAAALRRFREKTIAAGFPGLHLNAVTFGVRILPGETAVEKPEELVNYLGFDSVTSYVWIHHVALPEFPVTPYAYVMEKSVAHWQETVDRFDIPYHPNVTMGWDASPRCKQSDPFVNKGYPFMATIGDNTPEAFREALTKAKDFLETLSPNERVLTINCWNEWTEGSYLEPDTVHGMKYLEAVKEVFATK